MSSPCILIPVYNNPQTIVQVVEDCLDLNFFVILVDDGSSLAISSFVPTHPQLTILRHDVNQGKGKAILTGTIEAKARGYSHVVTIDGDGQHYPSESQHLLPLLTENCIVIGSRKFKENVPLSSKFGRGFSNFWIFVESGRWLGDTQSGFRAYPTSILDLKLQHSRYDFEIEVIIKHLWKKRTIKEVEIEVYYPPKDIRVSHFDKIKDNIRLSKIHSKLVFQNLFRIFN